MLDRCCTSSQHARAHTAAPPPVATSVDSRGEDGGALARAWWRYAFEAVRRRPLAPLYANRWEDMLACASLRREYGAVLSRSRAAEDQAAATASDAARSDGASAVRDGGMSSADDGGGHHSIGRAAACASTTRADVAPLNSSTALGSEQRCGVLRDDIRRDGERRGGLGDDHDGGDDGDDAFIDRGEDEISGEKDERRLREIERVLPFEALVLARQRVVLDRWRASRARSRNPNDASPGGGRRGVAIGDRRGNGGGGWGARFFGLSRQRGRDVPLEPRGSAADRRGGRSNVRRNRGGRSLEPPVRVALDRSFDESDESEELELDSIGLNDAASGGASGGGEADGEPDGDRVDGMGRLDRDVVRAAAAPPAAATPAAAAAEGDNSEDDDDDVTLDALGAQAAAREAAGALDESQLPPHFELVRASVRGRCTLALFDARGAPLARAALWCVR